MSFTSKGNLRKRQIRRQIILIKSDQNELRDKWLLLDLQLNGLEAELRRLKNGEYLQ
jgi:hypothetical protein